jgi:hypothetical protein
MEESSTFRSARCSFIIATSSADSVSGRATCPPFTAERHSAIMISRRVQPGLVYIAHADDFESSVGLKRPGVMHSSLAHAHD